MEDLNNDGLYTKEDVEIDALSKKSAAQRQMAWTALLAMLAATGFLFSPYIEEPRVEALADLLGLFYLSCSGIVGAYMGFTTWMNKK